MCVDGDAVGVTQDGVVHHLNPVVNGRNGTGVPEAVEVCANVPNPLHDVRGNIVDFVSDGHTVDVARAVLPHDGDERADLTVNLGRR